MPGFPVTLLFCLTCGIGFKDKAIRLGNEEKTSLQIQTIRRIQLEQQRHESTGCNQVMSISLNKRVFVKLLVSLLLAGTLYAQSAQPSPASPAAAQQDSPSAPASQQAAPGQSPEMVLKVTTRMVVVDVVVRDKKDQGVPDLEATDFIVREDGVEQKVSAFSFQRPGSRAAEEA